MNRKKVGIVAVVAALAALGVAYTVTAQQAGWGSYGMNTGIMHTGMGMGGMNTMTGNGGMPGQQPGQQQPDRGDSPRQVPYNYQQAPYNYCPMMGSMGW